MKARRRLWILLVVLVLQAVACNFPGFSPVRLPEATSPEQSSLLSPTPFNTPAAGSATAVPATSTPATPSPKPPPAYQPVFEPAPCAFPFPSGYTPECGYLAVPQDRAQPEGRWVRLHTAVFRSVSANPAPDPVIHLAGGPGSSSLDAARYLFQQGFDEVLEQRDFILFDQRGTGYSEPRLDCPERSDLTADLLENLPPSDEAARAIQDAFLRCRDRLVSEGVDLTAYYSAASAEDINDLRLTLGYERLNLYGVSYGTRLALTVIRDFPEAVRSAVLDSTYPLQINLYTSLAPNANRAFTVLFDRCAADPGCSAAYPDLGPVFYSLVDELNENPVPVNLAAGGANRRVLFTGDLLVDVLFVGLYNPMVTAYMPEMIYAIRQGDYAVLRERLSLYFQVPGAFGMQMSVQCAEEIPFNDAGDAYTAAEGVPPQIGSFFADSVQPLFAVCQEWGAQTLSSVENQPVVSDLPLLVLAGEFDPITPPDWGRLVAAGLPHAYYYEFPGNGHWVTRSSGCARQMALDFWENPEQSLDSACINSMSGLKFIILPR